MKKKWNVSRSATEGKSKYGHCTTFGSELKNDESPEAGKSCKTKIVDGKRREGIVTIKIMKVF